MQLHEYQKGASNRLVDRTRSILRSQERGRNLYLKAITGAGKTVILADYIQKVSEFYNDRENVAFVWMSIGTGGLQRQSQESLEQNLPEYMRIYNSDNFRSMERMEHNTLLVLNWESVNTMTIEEDGTIVYNNLAMREGEEISLPQLFDNTRQSGTKIVMVIDEAHIGAEKPSTKDVQRTTVLKREIDPNVIINVTATPVFAREIPPADIIYVNTEDVIAEGRIKKGVRIDDTMDHPEEGAEDWSFVERVVRSAVAKQKHLRELYEETGNGHINPLGLIQIPNSTKGTEMRLQVEKVLEELGYHYDRGNLAEAVEDNRNMEGVKRSDSPVSFIICKQAISTGWDAPRAQILVKLRDVKSTIFDAQTLGRILRMPAGMKDNRPGDTFRFFPEDDLNYAYVYTDRNYSLRVQEYKNIYPETQQLKEEFKEDVQSLVLPRSVLVKEKESMADGRLRNHVETFIINYWPQSERNLEELNVTTSIGTYQTEELEATDTVIETKEYRMSDVDVQLFVKEFLERVSRPYLDENRLFLELRRALQPHYADDFLSIRKWILTNASAIQEKAKEWNEEVRSWIEHQSKTKQEPFFFSETLLMNAKFEEEVFEKCAYTKQVLRDVQTERVFEKFLDTNPKVRWWIKNPSSGKNGLGIAYVDPANGKNRLFFPDYLTRFQNGSIGIYETKSAPDPYESNTNAKKLVLAEYISQLNQELDIKVYGGIVHLEKDAITGNYEIVKEDYQEPKE